MTRLFPATLLLFAVCGSAAHAEDAVLHADLLCDQAANVALARFALASNDDPPEYATLPAATDHGLSSRPGTDRTDCRLRNGPAIRIRSGEEQALRHGAGGLDPPAFFSLWIDRRKVLSKFVWKPGYDDSFNDKPWLVGLVIGPKSLTFCTKKVHDKAATCKQQDLDLRSHAVDTEEYPANSKPRPQVGAILVDPASSDVSSCQRYLHAIRKDTQIASADLPADSQLSGSVESLRERRPDNNYSLGTLDGAFGNLGERRIFVISGDTHYFDGDIYVLAPRQTSPDDIVAFFSGEDIEQDAAKPPRDGWTIISGGRPGLYPDASARYVHLVPEAIGGELFVLAYPANRDVRPSGILLKPLPTAGFASVCIFQRVEPHY